MGETSTDGLEGGTSTDLIDEEEDNLDLERLAFLDFLLLDAFLDLRLLAGCTDTGKVGTEPKVPPRGEAPDRGPKEIGSPNGGSWSQMNNWRKWLWNRRKHRRLRQNVRS